MEISNIMNIHELALNKTMKQRSSSQMKKGQEVGHDNDFQSERVDLKEKGLIKALANTVSQQTDTMEDVQAEASVAGNIVNLHT